MPDQPLFGAPPKPGDYVKGMLWLAGKLLASDATGMTLRVTAYSFTPPTAIDWGDSTYSAAAWTQDVAPTATVPGTYHVDHQYALAGIRRGYVENGIRARFNVDVGKVRIIDAEDRNKTIPQLEAEAREDMRDARDTLRWREGRVN
jgi:hypothetical protein